MARTASYTPGPARPDTKNGVNVNQHQPLRIVVIGTGFVGLTHAAICAEMGHRVLAYDIDPDRIAAYASGDAAAIERHVNEPGLAACIAAHLGRNLRFTAAPTVLAAALGAARNTPGARLVFLCVPTPPQPDGATDRGPYLAAIHQVADVLALRAPAPRMLVVNKSTVPIGTARLLQRILSMRGVRDVGVASNPEFLPQGDALAAARRPDRIVVGADTAADFALLRQVYAPMIHGDHGGDGGGDHGAPPGSGPLPAERYLETTPETAEAIKYVSNALLFTYISFWNGVGARLGERFPRIDLDHLRAGVTADARISPWGARVGIGAGGSCFGKDIRSLIHQIESEASPATLLRAVHEINERQKVYLLERATAEAGFRFEGKTVAVLGLAFKQNTNDMRDAAALRVIDALLARGVSEIRVHDPVVDQDASGRWLDPSRDARYARIVHHDAVADALRGSHALVVSTDWDQYRQLGEIIGQTVAPPYLILDGRCMIADAPALAARGYTYLPVGGALLSGRARPAVAAPEGAQAAQAASKKTSKSQAA